MTWCMGISQNNFLNKYVISFLKKTFSFCPLDQKYKNEYSYLTNLSQTFTILSTNNRDKVSRNNYFNSGARNNSWIISSA